MIIVKLNYLGLITDKLHKLKLYDELKKWNSYQIIDTRQLTPHPKNFIPTRLSEIYENLFYQ